MRSRNTMMTNSWLSGVYCGVFCAMLAIAGCASNGTSNGGTQPNQQGQQTAPYSQSGMNAPVILNLRGPNPVPSAGQFTLDLEIVANEPIQAPVSLQIQLPQGVQLVSGVPSETLSLPQAGSYRRQYVVQTYGPLNQPVVVEANAQGPNNSWGFNARRQYPPAVENTAPPTRNPGFGRPPAVQP